MGAAVVRASVSPRWRFNTQNAPLERGPSLLPRDAGTGRAGALAVQREGAVLDDALQRLDAHLVQLA